MAAAKNGISYVNPPFGVAVAPKVVKSMMKSKKDALHCLSPRESLWLITLRLGISSQSTMNQSPPILLSSSSMTNSWKSMDSRRPMLMDSKLLRGLTLRCSRDKFLHCLARMVRARQPQSQCLPAWSFQPKERPQSLNVTYSETCKTSASLWVYAPNMTSYLSFWHLWSI